MKRPDALENAFSLAGYFFVALLYLLPLPMHWVGFIPGDNGDSVPNLWPFWYFPHALMHGSTSLFHTPLQFFPDGISLIYASNSALGAVLMAPLTLIVSPAAGLNTWLMLHIWLGGWFFFRFCRLLGARCEAALLGGFAYACSPFVAVHLPGHYTLVQIAYTSAALFAMAQLATRCAQDKPGNLRTLFWPAAGLAFACWAVAITDFYLAVMTAFLLITALGHHLLTSRAAIARNRLFWLSLVSAAVCTIVMLLPWVYLVVQAKPGTRLLRSGSLHGKQKRRPLEPARHLSRVPQRVGADDVPRVHGQTFDLQ